MLRNGLDCLAATGLSSTVVGRWRAMQALLASYPAVGASASHHAVIVALMGLDPTRVLAGESVVVLSF